jgi:hypothetical protein
MVRCVQLLVASAFLSVAVLLPSDQALKAAPPKPKPPTKATFKPPKTTHHNTRHFKVQSRAPHWRGVAIVANQNVAHSIKRSLNHNGWQVKIRHSKRGGAYAVSARMVHWHTRAVVNNPVAAQRLAYMLMAQGFQARIV